MATSCDWSRDQPTCPVVGYMLNNVTSMLQQEVQYNSITQPTKHNNSASSWSGIRHPYWADFPSPTKEVHITIGFAMTSIGILAVSGNIFVICVFLRFRSLRTPGSLLMINLAFSDLMMALSGFPLYAVASFYGRWIYPDQVCLLYGACGATFGLLSINLLAAIAVDRYLVIAHSYSITTRTNKRQAVIMISVSWANSLCWSLPPLLGWNRYILEGFGTTCTFDYLTRTTADKAFVMSMFVCGFCIPLLLIIGSYSYIYSVVHRHEQMFRTMSRTLKARVMHGGKEATQRTEMKTARTVLLAVIFYCLSWIPYATVALIGMFGRYQLLTPLLTAVPGVFAKMSTIYNPFLYTFSHPRFRKKVMLLICKKGLGRDTHTSGAEKIALGTSMGHKHDRILPSESVQIPVSEISPSSTWSEPSPKYVRDNYQVTDALEQTDTLSLSSSARYVISTTAKPCNTPDPAHSTNTSGKARTAKRKHRRQLCQLIKKHKLEITHKEENGTDALEESHTFLQSQENNNKGGAENELLSDPVETVV